MDGALGRSVGGAWFEGIPSLKLFSLLMGAGGLLAAPAAAQMSMPGMTMPMPAPAAKKKAAADKPARKKTGTKKAPAQAAHPTNEKPSAAPMQSMTMPMDKVAAPSPAEPHSMDHSQM